MAVALSHRALNSGTTAQYLFLHQSPDLTILQVTTPGHLRSLPHNHLVWAVIAMYDGCERNIFYRRNSNRLIVDGEQTVAAPDIIMLPSDIVHAISNPLAQPSSALHVYGGALSNPARSMWNPFTFEEEPFDLSTLLKYEQEMNRGLLGNAT